MYAISASCYTYIGERYIIIFMIHVIDDRRRFRNKFNVTHRKRNVLVTFVYPNAENTKRTKMCSVRKFTISNSCYSAENTNCSLFYFVLLLCAPTLMLFDLYQEYNSMPI